MELEIIKQLEEANAVTIDLNLCDKERLQEIRSLLGENDRFKRYNIEHFELYLAEKIVIEEYENDDVKYYSDAPFKVIWRVISREEYVERFEERLKRKGAKR